MPSRSRRELRACRLRTLACRGSRSARTLVTRSISVSMNWGGWRSGPWFSLVAGTAGGRGWRSTTSATGKGVHVHLFNRQEIESTETRLSMVTSYKDAEDGLDYVLGRGPSSGSQGRSRRGFPSRFRQLRSWQDIPRDLDSAPTCDNGGPPGGRTGLRFERPLSPRCTLRPCSQRV